MTEKKRDEQTLVKPFGIQLLETMSVKETLRTRTGLKGGSVMGLHSMDSTSGSTAYNT